MEQPPCGLTNRRVKHRVRVLCRPGDRPGRGPGQADRWQHKLALGPGKQREEGPLVRRPGLDQRLDAETRGRDPGLASDTVRSNGPYET